jgi:hypothetical protein
MDIPVGAAIGALRASVQVISSHRRPLLDFYFQFHNDFDPEISVSSKVAGETKHRFQHVFVSFWVLNIGSVRAENASFALDGQIKPDWKIGERFCTEFPQLAPGQSIFLFSLNQFELWDGEKPTEFGLRADYNAPKKGLNWLIRLLSPWRGKHQYSTPFRFSAAMVAGEIPPAKYAQS